MPIVDNVKRILKSFPKQYYKLLLLIGPSGSGKTTMLKECCESLDCKYVNLNLKLSKKLKEIPFSERCYYVQDYIDEIIRNCNGELISIDNIEILFSKHLQIDPLGTLKNISKYQNLIVAWPGTIKDGYLTYAETWHKDYIKYNLNKLECSYLDLERGMWNEI